MPKKETITKDEDEINIEEILGEKKKTKRELSEDQKNVLRERLVKMREVAKAKREAKKAELIKDSNVSNDVFEKQYKDKFEMLDEKLTSISTDVSDLKKAKAEKARLKAEAKAKAEEEAKNKVAEPPKVETPQVQSQPQVQQPTPVVPEIKLSFRQRFKGSLY